MDVPNSQSYKADPISAKVRTGGAVVIWIAALALFAFALSNWADKGELERNPLGAFAASLSIPTLMFWWAWWLWNRKEKHVSGHSEDIPDRRRYVDLGIVTALFAIPTALFISIGLKSSGESAVVAWVTTIGFILSGFLIGLLVYRKRQIFVPDPPVPIVLSEDEIKAQSEAKAKWDRIAKQWWYRYPMAGVTFFGAWFLVDAKPHLWWLAAIAVIYGLVLAKELGFLALFGLGCIVVLWIFQGIASLPVSVAVIIGALIIAGAVSR